MPERSFMKKLITCIFALLMLVCFSITVLAVGDGNVDSGGGGMGSGTSTNKWIPGEDGVRVTVVKTSDGSQVGSSFDMTNISLRSTIYHFGTYSKLTYRAGRNLSIQAGGYIAMRPAIPIPKIISSGSGAASIEAIKKYFCSEYTVRIIADKVGIEYDTLISGDYKIVIEPVAYFLFNGKYFAMSAHQAALYDQILSGGLRAKMASLSHKNLPLAMFLERADLGYPAWTGSTSKTMSNDIIINNLGIGIVWFKDSPVTDYYPSVSEYDYIYRTDTDVITSVTINVSREYNPDEPLTARFKIGTQNYLVKNIVIPEYESQVVWVKWHTPSEPQDITIKVTAGSTTQYVKVKIDKLEEKEPPDPKATDRNDTFVSPRSPAESNTGMLSWGVWSAKWHSYWVWHSNWVWNGYRWIDRGKWVDEGWYDFTYNRYQASLEVTQSIKPDSKAVTASALEMKSGYGFNTNVTAKVISNASSNAYTQAQTSLMYFPEFKYETYFRVLDCKKQSYQSAFFFKENRFSTYKSRAHFTPIWYPDGKYVTYTKVYDAWTPAGMLTVNKNAELKIRGNLFQDWHIAPKK